MADGTREPDVQQGDGTSAMDEATPAGSEDDIVARLIKTAGPRPPVAPETLAQLRQKTHRHWRQKVARVKVERQRRQLRWLAVAAALVVGIGGSWLWRSQSTIPTRVESPIAQVESVFGGDWSAPPEGLVAGARLETEDGVRIALRLHSGASLRLDEGTRVVLESMDLISLEQGAVYVDSGEAENAAEQVSLAVRSPLGLARDIGTQFEVRLQADDLHVRVRQGEVQVDTADGSHQALAGSHLRIGADGTVERRDEASHGGPWAWILSTAPAIDLEGQTLAHALRWMAAETGWRLAYEDEALRDLVEGIVVHGAVQDLRPEEVPEVLLPGSGLSSVQRDGILQVTRQDPTNTPSR